MPTTPEMSETSPSPRQVSAGFFRFPFVGNASPRRFRGRAMSGTVCKKKNSFRRSELIAVAHQIAESHSEEIGPPVAGSSSPPPTGFSSHERPDPSLQTQVQQTDRRLRFPRFLRRTHSASASTEAPPYALFLRTKKVSRSSL